MKFVLRFLSVILISLLIACGGGRVPSPKTAQSVTEGYFKRYGSKYKTSPFANKNLSKVEINAVEEISLNNAQVDAFAVLKDSRVMRTLIKMRKQFPVGWRVESWEILDVH